MTTLAFETAERVLAARGAPADRVASLRTENGVVLAVADGAGNSSAGSAAAEAFLQLISASLQLRRLDASSEASWVRLLSECDQALMAQGHGGEATGVALYLSPAGVVGASVGDSEAWLIENASLCVLTEGQARKPLLGSGRARPVGFARPTHSGTLLLASDGLFKYALADQVQSTLTTGDVAAAAARLAELPRMPTGQLPDDVGLVVCRFKRI